MDYVTCEIMQNDLWTSTCARFFRTTFVKTFSVGFSKLWLNKPTLVMLNFSARLTEHCIRSKSARPGDWQHFFSCPKLNVSRLRRPGAVRAQPCIWQFCVMRWYIGYAWERKQFEKTRLILVHLGVGGGGVKWAPCRSQVYQFLLLPRVIDVKYGCFTFTFLPLLKWM